MNKKYMWALVAFCIQLGVASAATIYIENFDNLDPSTDTNGTGSAILGGQGQLEDIQGTIWSGLDTDTGNLQTRVTTNQTLNIYSHSDATVPQINTSAVFIPQDQSSEFGLSFDLESWGTDNNGAGMDNFLGRIEIGVRDSTTNTNVFGIEIVAKWKDPTTLFAVFYDYTSGTRTPIGGESASVKGGTIGSFGFAYDGAGNVTLNGYAGTNQTGTILLTTSGAISNSTFSADSLYIKASANNIAKARVQNIQIDNLTVTSSGGSVTPSAPVITDITLSGGVVSVTATNLSLTSKYILIRTDDLTGSFTNEVAGSEITPTNQMSVLQDSVPLEGEAFYKVQSKE